MAAGIKKLQKLQIGLESVAGTPLAATTVLRGVGGMLSDNRKVEEVEEIIGIIGGADRDAIVQLLTMIDIPAKPLTPEQFQYVLAMALGGPTTGSADGVGTDFIYTTNLPTTAVPTAKTYTVEGGDNFEVERAEYCVVTKFGITFAANSLAKVQFSIMGRQSTRMAGGFTAALSLPALSELPVNKAKAYLDAIGGVYGTTQLTNTLIGGQLNFTTAWVPVFTTDGNLYYSYPSYTDTHVDGTLTFLHDTAAGGSTGAKADFRARTPKLLRLDFIGDAVGTPGTTYSTKKIIVDLPIKYLSAPAITDQNGVDQISFTFRSRYNTTAGNAGKFIVVNELAALP
jgi:hypothetical protein